MRVAVLVESWGEPWNEGYKNLAKYVVESINNFIDLKVFSAHEAKKEITSLENFDIVHVFNYKIPLHHFAYLAKVRRPIIKHVAKEEINSNITSFANIFYMKFLWKAFILTTNFLVNEVRRWAKEKPIFCIPPPIPINYYKRLEKNEARKLLRLKQEALYIGCAGALNKFKRLDVVLDAIRKVKPELRDEVELVVSPSHVYPPKYCDKMKNLFLRSYDLCKVLKINDVRIFYSAVDLIVYPSDYLGSISPPLTVLEAMSSETLVAAKRNPITSTIIKNGFNGFLFSSTEELVEIIKNLAKGNVERDTITRRAREYVVKNHDPSKLYKKYIEVYRKIIEI
jgi:glycosyltransferase involved in cell wall biosynthesis